MTAYKFKKEEEKIIILFLSLFLYITLRAFLEDYIPSTFVRAGELLCALTFSCIFLRYSRPKNLQYGKILIFLIIIWFAFILYRGDFNLQGKAFYLKFISTNTLVYLLPFLAIVPLRRHFDRIIKLFYYFSLATIPIWLLNIGHLVVSSSSDMLWIGESIGQYLPFFAAFLILFMYKVPIKKRKWVWGIFFVYLILMLLNSRRNILVSFSLCFIGYMIFSNKINITKGSNIAFLSIFFLVIIYILINPDFLAKLFPLLFQRGVENTREGVTEIFMADYLTWDPLKHLIGQGLDGSYYQPIYDPDTGELISTQRAGIETGYLDMLLKGGIIYDFLIVAIVIFSIYKGFKSKDPIGKRCAYYLIICLIDLYTTCLLGTLGVKSILFWVSISLCLSSNKTQKKTISTHESTI